MRKVLFVFLACVVAFAVVTAGAATWRFYAFAQQEPVPQLSLVLNGRQEILLEYGQLYTEPGAVATYTFEDTVTDVPVHIVGQVNPQQLGEQTLTYSVQVGDLVRTETRRIFIIDTAAPTISLVSNPDSVTIIGHPYAEEGFAAWDNFDGDITHQVVRTESDGIVTYSVADSSGNTCSVSRQINYFDPGKPNIQLFGNQTLLLVAGDEYIEPGYIATDSNDGDITVSVSVEGSVDTQSAGLYTLHYTSVNSYGFASTAERQVYVFPPELVPVNGESTDKTDTPDDTQEFVYPENCVIPQGGMAYQPNGKVIYLTFDDGPSQHTGRLLDILAKYQIKASFFVINSSRIDMIARTAKEGHTVAIHAYSHDYAKIYANDDAFLADLQAMQDVIVKHTGQKTMLTRFPGGSSNTISSAYNKGIMSRLAKTLPEMGYTYFDWNVDSKDAGGAKTPEKVFENIAKEVQWYKNSIVLQHDTHGYSVDAVERLIVWGLINGYTFQPLTADSPTCHHPILN